MKTPDNPPLKEVNGVMCVDSKYSEHPGLVRVNKYLYIILAVLFGVFGAHRFYARKFKSGILYLLFCWTLIPEIFALFDTIKACGMLRDENDNIWL